MITIPMTPEQFSAARNAISASPDVTHSATTSTSSGIVATNQIDFTYVYDGSAQLSLTITGRHGLAAHMASEDQIKARLLQMLAAASNV